MVKNGRRRLPFASLRAPHIRIASATLTQSHPRTAFVLRFYVSASIVITNGLFRIRLGQRQRRVFSKQDKKKGKTKNEERKNRYASLRNEENEANYKRGKFFVRMLNSFVFGNRAKDAIAWSRVPGLLVRVARCYVKRTDAHKKLVGADQSCMSRWASNNDGPIRFSSTSVPSHRRCLRRFGTETPKCGTNAKWKPSVSTNTTLRYQR